MKVCGAPTAKGGQCKRPLPCPYHGTPLGRYRGYLSDVSIKEAYLKYLADEDILDLSDEIALLRAVVSKLAQEERYMDVLEAANQLSKVVSRLHDIQLKRQTLMPLSQVFALLEQAARAVLQEVPDPTIRERLAQRLLSLPAPQDRTDRQYR